VQIKYVDQAQLLQDFLPLIVELECGDHYDSTNPQHATWIRARIAALYVNGAKAICLYSEEDKPVGLLLLIHDPGLMGVRCFGKKGTIAMFGLMPEYRSKGIGATLLREAETCLRRNGGDCLYVDTYAGSPRAIRYYIREGFIPVAYHPGVYGIGDLGQVYLYKEMTPTDAQQPHAADRASRGG
jgi:ribosomal protein S18 acetylase RimI-like enzyme